MNHPYNNNNLIKQEANPCVPPNVPVRYINDGMINGQALGLAPTILR